MASQMKALRGHVGFSKWGGGGSVLLYQATTVRTRTGTPCSYSTVTCVLPSGRRYGSWPDLRTSASRRAMRWASAIGSGISSGVSRQANPNIIPWSPAPSSFAAASSRTSSAAFTPWAMSGDWPLTETSVPQVW